MAPGAEHPGHRQIHRGFPASKMTDCRPRPNRAVRDAGDVLDQAALEGWPCGSFANDSNTDQLTVAEQPARNRSPITVMMMWPFEIVTAGKRLEAAQLFRTQAVGL